MSMCVYMQKIKEAIDKLECSKAAGVDRITAGVKVWRRNSGGMDIPYM